MDLRSANLWAKGGLSEAQAPCLQPRTIDEVVAAFERVKRAGKRCTLIGQRKSFGEQFLPPDGEIGLDLSRLCVGARALEPCDDGLWVRVGAGTTFAQLHARFPSYAPHCPPTSDGISWGGALAACTHNAIGYLADAVRAFTLVTPSGRTYHCREDSDGVEGELFRQVPGTFGLLGVVTDIEVRLNRVEPGQQYVVNALHAGTPRDDAYIEQLERVVDDPRYRWGNGALVYGNRRHYIVFGDEKLAPGQTRDERQALLTDDRLVQQAITQGIVNRFPRLAEIAMSRAYHEGAGLPAPWYGFLFFQRSYDIAHEVLSGPGLGFRLLRAIGVDPKLTVCHQTWFYPRERTADFMNVYWSTMDDFPGVERRAEQQDMVFLPPCRWPSHTMGATEGRIGALTCTFSVRRGRGTLDRTSEFLREVSRRASSACPDFRVSLCKQLHCDDETLRGMHMGYVERVAATRRTVDPDGLLTSRFWERMTGAALVS